jgi:hypothetical protein
MARTDYAWPGGREIPAASAARTASGNSGTLSGYGAAKTLRAQLDVTAASGTTPTLDVVVEDSVDGGTNWNTVGTFAQKTTTGREVINVTTPFSDDLRVRWTIGGGTPSFTFSVAWAVDNW